MSVHLQPTRSWVPDPGVHDGPAACAVAVLPSGAIVFGFGRSIGIDDGNSIWVLGTHQREVTSINGSPDGRLVISGSADGCVALWGLEAGACRWSGKKHGRGVRCVGFLNGSGIAYSGGGDGKLRFYDSATGRITKTLEHTMVTEVHAVAPLADSVRLFAACNVAVIWNMSTGTIELARQYPGWRKGGERASASDLGLRLAVERAVLAPDGREVLLGCSGWNEESTVALLVTADRGDERAVLRGHHGWSRRGIRSVGFLAAGRYAVTTAWDSTIRLWEVASGAARDCVPIEEGRVSAMAVAPEGDWLVVASQRGFSGSGGHLTRFDLEPDPIG